MEVCGFGSGAAVSDLWLRDFVTLLMGELMLMMM